MQAGQEVPMRQRASAVLVALVGLATVTSGFSITHGQKAEVRPENKLVGTWKQVSGKFNGKEFRPPEGTTLIKHITQTQFMFVDVDRDGRIVDAAGGPYTLTADKYEETALYAIGDFHGLKGKTQSFAWKIEGNRWFHSGTLSSGLTLEEVWERIEPKL
jgi:hypothetical protein